LKDELTMEKNSHLRHPMLILLLAYFSKFVPNELPSKTMMLVRIFSQHSVIVLVISVTTLINLIECNPTLPPTETEAPTIQPTELPTPTLPRFEPTECRFFPNHISNVECGDLYVLENREQNDGREIRLHVAIARSYSDGPKPDPLIFLSGGPGSFSLEWLYRNLGRYTDILKHRDVIFFDPRGVGFSEPSLDCPEVMESFHGTLGREHSSKEWVDSIVTANLACRKHLLEAGIDLSAYNSAEMAADVNDLRAALGYEKVNLYGVSYGSRTALTVMRDYPVILNSVVLDSVVPLEKDILGSDLISADQALNSVFEHCAADSACNAAYPDLQTAYRELIAQLDANPITIKVTHLVTNEVYDVWVDDSILGASIHEALYNYETIVYLPKLIYDTLDGDDEEYKTLATSLEIYLFYGDYSSEGMRYSVLCSDEGTFTSLESAQKKYISTNPAIAEFINNDLEMIYRTCDVWGAKIADPIENQPVFSNIPTLVLAGEFDPITPPSFGQLVADTLENAYYVEFPGLGHNVFADRSCARDIVAEFLEKPDTKPDSSCVNSSRINFILR
jgi:pimeloyl-ACP methyl ester carboxylesterase